MLPYIGSSLALGSYRSKKMQLDYISPPKNIKEYLFLEKAIKLIIPILLILQIFSWIYIYFNYELTNTDMSLFAYLRTSSVYLKNVVPPLLSYPNGLCFAGFCIALASYRCYKNGNQLKYLIISIIIVFLNDMQSSGRAGMAFIVFTLTICTIWDWRIKNKNPTKLFSYIVMMGVLTQLAKILREGDLGVEKLNELIISVFRYCFSYLNTLSELLNRLPEANWIGARTFLPLINFGSRIIPGLTRSAIHSVEVSSVWGYNNYTMAGEFIRDFSYIGCLLIPFLITKIFLYYTNKGSQPLNIAISSFYGGWIVYGCITNILMMGGFMISCVFLFALKEISYIYIIKDRKRQNILIE